MAAPRNFLIYAVEDAAIAKVTADPVGGTTTYDTIIDVPGIKNVGLDFEINNVELRGDNRRLASDSTLVGVNGTFEHAMVSLDALAVMIGGAVTDSGADAAEVATFRRIATDAFSYFKFEAKTPTAGGGEAAGDVHLVIYKAKITAYSLGLAEENYQTFSGSFSGVARLSDGRYFDVVNNETAAALA